MHLTEVEFDSNEQIERPFATWKRLLFGFLWIVGAGMFGWSLWVTGMLMLAFSMDGANSSEIPNWMEPLILIGWAPMVAIASLIPPALFMFGVRAKQCWRLQAVLLAINLAIPVVTWFALISAIT